MPNTKVKVGVSAEDLEEQGVTYEKGTILPQIPDYLGYVLGLLIVWLIYTSYYSAVETVREPIAKISKQAVEIKETVEEYAETTKQEQSIKDSAVLVNDEDSSEGFWYSKLELVNSAISWAADYVSDQLQEVLPSSDYDEVSPNNSSNRRPKQQRRDANYSAF